MLNIGGLTLRAAKAQAEAHFDLSHDEATSLSHDEASQPRRSDLDPDPVSGDECEQDRKSGAAARSRQQQPRSTEDRRLDGLIAACAVRARATRAMTFDEAAHRKAVQDGTLPLEDLQQLADDLAREPTLPGPDDMVTVDEWIALQDNPRWLQQQGGR